MMNPTQLEERYQTYVKDLRGFVPDGVIEVDLALLQDLGLLSALEKLDEEEVMFTHSFYVVESGEKLTLFNQKFVVWIVPKLVDQNPTTYTFVALNSHENVNLEMVFSTAGVYNHSSLVLKILEKFLKQIEENEKEINKIKSE